MKTKSILTYVLIFSFLFARAEENFDQFYSRFQDKKTSFNTVSQLDVMVYYDESEWADLTQSINTVNDYYIEESTSIYNYLFEDNFLSDNQKASIESEIFKGNLLSQNLDEALSVSPGNLLGLGYTKNQWKLVVSRAKSYFDFQTDCIRKLYVLKKEKEDTLAEQAKSKLAAIDQSIEAGTFWNDYKIPIIAVVVIALLWFFSSGSSSKSKANPNADEN